MSQRIAIVISTYNRKDVLPDTVQSCLSQETPEGWEMFCVVVDDGSTDGTAEAVCRQHALVQTDEPDVWRDHNLVLIRTPNRERGAARNRGARYAIERLQVTWLLFLDSDDILAPRSMVHFHERLKGAADLVALYANCVFWYGDNRFGRKKFDALPPEGDLRLTVLTRPSLTIGTTLVSAKSFLTCNGFCEERTLSGSEDWEFWFRLSMLGPIAYSNHISLWYRRHETSTRARQFETSVTEAMNRIERTLVERLPHVAPEYIAKLRVYGSYLLCGTFNSEGNTGRAWRYWLRAQRLNPLGILTPRPWRFLLSMLRMKLKPAKSSS